MHQLVNNRVTAKAVIYYFYTHDRDVKSHLPTKEKFCFAGTAF